MEPVPPRDSGLGPADEPLSPGIIRRRRLRSCVSQVHISLKKARQRTGSVCPIPASSGKITRYRLNRGGDSNANAALYRIVLTRMSSHDETRRYVSRRRAEGRSTAEIMRCLKRYVARQVYKHLPTAT